MTAFQLLMAAAVANLTLVASAQAAKGLFRRVSAAAQAFGRRILPLGRLMAPWRGIPIRVAA
jgi:hypothetical protein